MSLVFSSTTRPADAIRARRISATETLEAHLSRIDQCNPALNGIITMDVDLKIQDLLKN